MLIFFICNFEPKFSVLAYKRFAKKQLFLNNNTKKVKFRILPIKLFQIKTKNLKQLKKRSAKYLIQ